MVSFMKESSQFIVEFTSVKLPTVVFEEKEFSGRSMPSEELDETVLLGMKRSSLVELKNIVSLEP